MRSEDGVRAAYEAVQEDYGHVLDAPPATILENAPRALMQVEAKTRLEVLAWVLGETVPKDAFAAYEALEGAP